MNGRENCDTSRPKVLANFAMSLDGKIGMAAAVRPARFQLSPQTMDHQRMRALRNRADAIVIGGGNVRADDPELGLLSDDAAQRTLEGRSLPIRGLMTRSGRDITSDLKIFDPALGGETIIFHPRGFDLGFCSSPEGGAPQLGSVGFDVVTVAAVLDWLAKERGCKTVLCEGGGEIYGAFMRARAIDELFVTVVPRWLGGSDAPTAGGGEPFSPEAIPQAKLASVEAIEGELFLRYTFDWSALP